MPPIIARALLAALIVTTGVSVAAVHSPSQAMADEADNAFTDITLAVFPHQGTGSSFWNSWGARRSGGRRHKGIDIMAQRGNPIVAVADGVVAAMDSARLSGYFIRIQHADGWMSVYMHLNNDTLGTDDGAGGPWTAYFPTLKVGDTVAAGQVIGYVGDSGNAEGTRPHTHFELRHEGTRVNPYPYLLDVWKRERRLPTLAGVPV